MIEKEKWLQAFDKIRSDLDWRGPNGECMGYAVLRRDLAETLLAWYDNLIEEEMARMIAKERGND